MRAFAKLSARRFSFVRVLAKSGRTNFLIGDALPFGRLWYTEIPHAIGYAELRSRSCNAVIRVYDESGHVIATHEHADDLKE